MKTRTPVVETKPPKLEKSRELLADPAEWVTPGARLAEPIVLPVPKEYAPPIAPATLVASPPQAAPTQLDRIEALLTRAVKRLQC